MVNNNRNDGYATVTDLLKSDQPSMSVDEMSTLTPRLRDSKHKEDTVRSNRITVIDIYADWCGPCKQIAPQFAALAQKYNKHGICQCVVENHDDKLPPVPGTPQYQGVPTFCVYIDGAHFASITGGDMEQIEQSILKGVEKAQELDNLRSQSQNDLGQPHPGGSQFQPTRSQNPMGGPPPMMGPSSMGGQQQRPGNLPPGFLPPAGWEGGNQRGD